MARLEEKLDPKRFLRIHRSIIVNVDRVKTLTSWGLGEYLFELTDGTKLSSSRRYRGVIRWGATRIPAPPNAMRPSRVVRR